MARLKRGPLENESNCKMWKVVLTIALPMLYVGYQLFDGTDLAQIDNKRVLVTGASRGIGEQLAYSYARLGANVVIVARSEDKLKKVIAKCKSLAPDDRTFDYIVADLSDLNATEHVIQNAIKKLGGLDYLVLNHMGLSMRGEWRGTADQYNTLRKSYDLNFFSYVYMASHALPALEEASGSILVIGSLAGKTSIPQFAAYSSEKFALDGFLSAWRMELAMRSVPVSMTYCVVGLVDTESARLDLAGSKADRERLVRYADPVETAQDIITAGMSRVQEMYTPFWSTKLTVMLSRSLFKRCIDSSMEYAMQGVG